MEISKRSFSIKVSFSQLKVKLGKPGDFLNIRNGSSRVTRGGGGLEHPAFALL